MKNLNLLEIALLFVLKLEILILFPLSSMFITYPNRSTSHWVNSVCTEFPNFPFMLVLTTFSADSADRSDDEKHSAVNADLGCSSFPNALLFLNSATEGLLVVNLYNSELEEVLVLLSYKVTHTPSSVFPVSLGGDYNRKPRH